MIGNSQRQLVGTELINDLVEPCPSLMLSGNACYKGENHFVIGEGFSLSGSIYLLFRPTVSDAVTGVAVQVALARQIIMTYDLEWVSNIRDYGSATTIREALPRPSLVAKICATETTMDIAVVKTSDLAKLAAQQMNSLARISSKVSVPLELFSNCEVIEEHLKR